MIGKITGRLDYVASDHALIEAAGVGYIIYCSDRTLAVLPTPGERVAVYTEMVVREDAMTLYGFLTLAEKEWHRLLTSVQGVGAKSALAVLGTLGPEGIGRAISLGDLSAVRAAPGIGPKSAQRIVLELKDKVPGVMALGARGATPATVSGMPETPPAQTPEAPSRDATAVASPGADLAAARADALSALVNLGYGHGDAASAVAEAESASDAPPEAAALIRMALKLLAPKG